MEIGKDVFLRDCSAFLRLDDIPSGKDDTLVVPKCLGHHGKEKTSLWVLNVYHVERENTEFFPILQEESNKRKAQNLDSFRGLKYISGPMTKKELVRALGKNLGVSQTVAARIVDAAFEEITSAFCKEGSLLVTRFGRFNVSLRKPGIRKNPLTNERVQVGRTCRVSFSAAPTLRDRILKNSRRHQKTPA